MVIYYVITNIIDILQKLLYKSDIISWIPENRDKTASWD